MRSTILATLPLYAALIASPATAQITAHVHIDIPIGRRPDVVYRPEAGAREIRIYDYDRSEYGDWDRDRDYRRWQPITVYYYAGRYYERSFRGARPVVIYRYRDRYFYPPRDGRWEQRYGRDRDWARPGDRDDRYNQGRDDRNGRDRDDRNGNNGRGQDNRGQDNRGQDNRGQGAGGQDSHGGRPDPKVPPGRGGRSRP